MEFCPLNPLAASPHLQEDNTEVQSSYRPTQHHTASKPLCQTAWVCPNLSHKMRFSTLLPLGFCLPPQGHMQMTVLFLKPAPMRPLHSLSSRIMTECNSVNSKSSPGRCPLTLPELGDERRQPDLRQAAGLSE